MFGRCGGERDISPQQMAGRNSGGFASQGAGLRTAPAFQPDVSALNGYPIAGVCASLDEQAGESPPGRIQHVDLALGTD